MSETANVALKAAPARTPRVARLDSLKNPQPRPPPKGISAKDLRRGVAVLSRPKVTICTNAACPKSDIVEDEGQKICQSCGTVIQDLQPVGEVAFGETRSGAAVVQGSYVGADQSHARNAAGTSKIAGGMDSREITEANGRRYINQLAAALQIPQAYTDAAMQVYKLAYGINFIQGRRTKNVAAICLYIACRREKENRIMLIDFSDILMVNVFKLGQTYNNLVEELGLRRRTIEEGGGIEPINPESLIYRFASRLEFGDDTYRVAKEAVKVLQRMDRDWMTTGRRPAGVCGAALILAARMNNFRRTIREVVYIVKVTEVTIHKRLDEFKYTQSSDLTVDQFRAMGQNLEHATDPPAFYEQFDKSKKKKCRRKSKKNDQDEEQSEEEDADLAVITSLDATDRPRTSAAAAKAQSDSQAMPPPPVPIDPALLAVQALDPTSDEAIRALSEEQSGLLPVQSSPKRKRGRPAGAKNKPLPTPTATQITEEDGIETEISGILADPGTVAHASDLHQALTAAQTKSPPTSQSGPASSTANANTSAQKASSTAPDTQNPPPRSAAQLTTAAQAAQDAIPDTEIIPEEEFADDPEVSNCLLSPTEVDIKERIWVHENAEYLRLQQAKMIKKQLEEANGTARVVVKRKRRRGRMGDMRRYESVGIGSNGENSSARRSPAEMVESMLKYRGYSKKINYEMVRELYATSSSRSSSVSGSRAGSAVPSTVGAEEGSRGGTPLGVGTTDSAGRDATEVPKAVVGAPGASVMESGTAGEPALIDDDEEDEADEDDEAAIAQELAEAIEDEEDEDEYGNDYNEDYGEVYEDEE
ncbi:transcription factor TFIIIB subunit brf1 [Bachmanniomyces sp. S44760]|nr:transcription factor TFIIIB subunit brf1 [Bachmanniomyces sp. S44760]